MDWCRGVCGLHFLSQRGEDPCHPQLLSCTQGGVLRIHAATLSGEDGTAGWLWQSVGEWRISQDVLCTVRLRIEMSLPRCFVLQ